MLDSIFLFLFIFFSYPIQSQCVFPLNKKQFVITFSNLPVRCDVLFIFYLNVFLSTSSRQTLLEVYFVFKNIKNPLGVFILSERRRPDGFRDVFTHDITGQTPVKYIIMRSFTGTALALAASDQRRRHAHIGDDTTGPGVLLWDCIYGHII